VDWETDGHHLGYIPLDLHGNHSPMVHHCMLKEAHTISYIQQANHKWIEGDCRNPSLGSRPWQRELQGCGPKGSPGVKPKGSPRVKPKGSPGAKARGSLGVKPRGSPGVTSHTPGSARKC